jgi:hypothetical protein
MLRKLIVFAITSGLAAKAYRAYRGRAQTPAADTTPEAAAPVAITPAEPVPLRPAGFTNGIGAHVH